MSILHRSHTGAGISQSPLANKKPEKYGVNSAIIGTEQSDTILQHLADILVEAYLKQKQHENSHK